MATARIVEESTANGEWSGYGTAGYSILTTGTSSPTVVESLPAGVASFGWGGLDGPYSFPNPADDKCLRMPDASKSVFTWTRSVGGSLDFSIAAASESTGWLASFRFFAASAGRPADLTVATSDGSATLAKWAVGDLFDGRWVRIAGAGSVRVSVSGTYPRVQGVLFDPPPAGAGRLICIEPGSAGTV